MIDLLLRDQYARLLDNLPAERPWPALVESGFLDLLRPEAEGGAGLDLSDLFQLCLETGRRTDPPAVIETIAARVADPNAIDVRDPEPFMGRPLAAALAAAQMVGAMTRVQEMTIDYARTRRQFGREIGRFQAVQHQISVMAEDVAAAHVAAQAALTGAPQGISLHRTAVAKVRCGQAAEKVSAIAHAVFGAIGVSQAHDLHRYTRRLRAWCFAHGGQAWWARELGQWALGESQDFTSLARTL